MSGLTKVCQLGLRLERNFVNWRLTEVMNDDALILVSVDKLRLNSLRFVSLKLHVYGLECLCSRSCLFVTSLYISNFNWRYVWGLAQSFQYQTLLVSNKNRRHCPISRTTEIQLLAVSETVWKFFDFMWIIAGLGAIFQELSFTFFSSKRVMNNWNAYYLI